MQEGVYREQLLDRVRRRVLRAWPLIVGLLAFAALWSQSYNGREAVALNARADCRASMGDRHAQAEAWYSAYLARAAQARQGGVNAGQYAESAAVYLASARALNGHLDRAHSVQWPVGSGRLPLGPGRFDCRAAFPDASPWQFFG